MTAINDALVGPYHVETALRLLGPADFGVAEPHGCMDHAALILNQIVIFVFRVFNLICGDRQWYDNETARRIVEQYAANPQPNTLLDQQVRVLYAAILLRAHGDVSYAHEINPLFFQRPEPHLEIPLIDLIRSEHILDDPIHPIPLDGQFGPLFTRIPVEILVKEILPRCDEESLLHLLSTCKALQYYIKGEPKLYKDLLIQLALKKAMAIANRQPIIDKVHVLCEFAKMQVRIHPESANALLQEALEACGLLTDSISSSPIQKSAGLLLVVSAQALLHPEIAICTANLIQDPSIRENAFASIANAQASTNIEQAISTVDRISDVHKKSFCLSGIFKLQALTDPEKATTNTNRFISIPRAKDNAFREIVRTLALANPNKAIEIAMMIQDDSIKESAFISIVKAYAATNLEEAIAFANRIGDPARKDNRLYWIVFHHANAHNIEHALTTANLIQDEGYKVHALCEIVKQFASTHPARSEELCQEALNIVHSHFEVLRNKDRALFKIVEAQALINTANAQMTAHLIQDSYWKEEALIAIVRAQALISAEPALATANTIQDEKSKNAALDFIVQMQALTDLPKAFETLNLIQDPFSKNIAIHHIALSLGLRNFEEALACTDRIDLDAICSYTNADNLRIATLCQILKENASARPHQANALFLKGLTHASLIPDERHQVDTLIKVVQAFC